MKTVCLPHKRRLLCGGPSIVSDVSEVAASRPEGLPSPAPWEVHVDSADVLDEEDTSCCTSGKQACSATGPDAPEGWRARVEGDGGVPAMPLPGRSLQVCYHNLPRPPCSYLTLLR